MTRTGFIWISAVTFSAALLLLAQQGQQNPPPQHRDLEVVPDTGSTKPAVPPPGPVLVPRGYALVIGISQYPNLAARFQLKYPYRDADLMKTALIDPKSGEFEPENVHVLKDNDATLTKIKYELETWLPSVAKDPDRVVIYFAGHGFLDPNTGKPYLAPADFKPDDIPDTAYPMSSLGDVIANKIHARWKVLLADACHSGAIAPEQDRAAVTNSLLDLNKSLFVVTASRDREQSLEGPGWGGGHGIFTWYVSQALRGQADTNGDGVVSAQELGDYVYENVSEATNQKQHPTFDRGSFDPNMVLAYDPDHAETANLPAPKDGTLVIETNMDGVEVSIDGKPIQVVNKGTPLRLPGQKPGMHTVQGNHLGYEPDGPREIEVYPGQDTTVTLRIMIARQRNKAALDELNHGIQLYNKGYEKNYKEAAEDFKKALAIDPTYSQAALFLGRSYRSFYDYDDANQAFKQAISIDSDYLEARVSYAGGLLDTGDFDEAIRQLDFVTQREANNGTAWYLLSQAYLRKGVFDQAVKASREAVKLIPNKAEAHLWLGDSLRMYDDSKKTKVDFPEAENEYRQYLALSNFNSNFGGKLNYYVTPLLFGLSASKKRAAQVDIWRQLRAQANFGLCDCEYLLAKYDSAIRYCDTALSYDPQDLYTHYRLGLTYMAKFNDVNAHATSAGGFDLLVEARKQCGTVISLNSDVEQAVNCRKNIQNIDQFLGQHAQ